MKRILCILSLICTLALAQTDQARVAPEWLKSGVIYQVFPRSFSQEGTLAGVTSHLDDLHKLGVNILWLMPIHPLGQLKKKGSLGSMYSVRDYYAIDSVSYTHLDVYKRQNHQSPCSRRNSLG